MRFFIAALLAGALSLHAPRSYAQEPVAPSSVAEVDLPSLLSQVEQNPNLRAMRLEAEALATRPEQVSARPDPTVSVGYRPLAVRSPAGILPPQVMAEQMIPYPGKLRLASEIESLGAQAAEAEADAMALDITQEIQEAYFTLYRIQQQDRLAAELAERLGDFEEAAAVRYEVGQGPQMSILKAQVERLSLERQRLTYAAERRTALERLARLTDRPDLASPAYTMVLAPPTVDLALDMAVEPALARRPEAEALRLMQAQASREIERARLESRPDFMVGAGIMDMPEMGRPVRPLSNIGDRLAVQVGVVIPLQKGKRRAAVQEAELRRRQVDARLEALETEVRTEVQALYASLVQDAEALELIREALVPQAEAAVQSTLAAYSTGQADFLELLDSERMLYDMRMEQEMTLERFAMTRARLERTLGLRPPPLPAETLTTEALNGSAVPPAAN